MKICPKCNTGNGDSALQCKDCGTYIGVTKVTNDSKIIDDFNRKEKRKETIKLISKILSFVIAVVSYILFFAKASLKEDFLQVAFMSLLLISMGYFVFFHAEVAFKMKYSFIVQDINNVEPSDLYLLFSRLSGIVLFLIGIFLLFIFAFFPI